MTIGAGQQIYVNLHDKANVLETLAQLNVNDKIRGSREGSGVKWERHPTGTMQGVSRAAANTLQGAAGMLKWGASYIPGVGASLAPVKEEDVPALLADAKTTTTQIHKEITDLAECVEIAKVGLNAEIARGDMNTLKMHRDQIKYLTSAVNCGTAGLQNLKSTYSGEKDSLKRWVMGGTPKYGDALQKLTEAEASLEATRATLKALEGIITQRERLQGERLQARNQPLPAAQLAALDKVPSDFPKSLEQSPKNMLLMIGNYLSDPILSQMPDDRQLSCAANGELGLALKETDVKESIKNFTDAVGQTYGQGIQLAMHHDLTTEWTSFTWGQVKSAIASLPDYASKAEGLSGDPAKESCLLVLPKADRDRIRQDPQAGARTSQFAISHMLDKDGKVAEIKDLFLKEYIAHLTTKLNAKG